jgi:hypothetical protein
MTEREYIIGQDRNEDGAVAHIYEGPVQDPGRPLCVRGWNRHGGFGYSIFRNVQTGPLCKICERRAEKGLPGVEPRERKTKWL